ncbi:hypothetical protein P7F88_20345 [Vibrio hannami]|uniref:hypothetical protein n=1 Tax=Vibrio hannami TaxID=2717094 RepID=UPI00240FB8DA|nr:hypothetical protein [Vibrio hannami]MDG3088293.1 hypothetical protein [Vibrio hannami]
MITRELCLELISAGIRASSPDNSQPWKFSIVDDSIELFLDSRYLGMFFDPNQYASLLGCGGVIENIRLKALTKGFDLYLFPESDVAAPDYKVVSIKLVPLSGENGPDNLAEAIPQRCTNRGFFYRDWDIPSFLLDKFNTALNDFDGAEVQWFEGERRKEIITILSNTDRIRYTNKSLHDDFYAKLRYGNEIEKQCDGLASDTLGLESLFTATLPLLKSWSFAKFLNLFGMQYFMAYRGATVPLKNANKIGALVMPRETDVITQGRALQRLWLTINAQKGVHFQPFGALPLLIYRMVEYKGDGFSEHEREFLEYYMNQLEQLMNIEFGHSHVVIFFRMGYAEKPKAFSRRRELASFLIDG